MYCKNCGAHIPDGSEFCQACGARNTGSGRQRQQNYAPQPQYQPPQKNRGNGVIIALIAMVAVVAVAAIICFTILTSNKQKAQMAAIEAQNQTEQAASSSEKDSSSSANSSSSKDDAEEDTSDDGDAGSTTTVNNYYYYDTNNHTDDYYHNVSTDGYLWPTDEQYISSSDLSGLGQDTVAAIRNEIYARHGYAFEQSRWQSYFGAKDWYHRNESCNKNTVESYLTSLEKANIDTIVEYEESMGWR